jgi:hypothetical protein
MCQTKVIGGGCLMPGILNHIIHSLIEMISSTSEMMCLILNM